MGARITKGEGHTGPALLDLDRSIRAMPGTAQSTGLDRTASDGVTPTDLKRCGAYGTVRR